MHTTKNSNVTSTDSPAAAVVLPASAQTTPDSQLDFYFTLLPQLL
jgi:hypothetical protein